MIDTSEEELMRVKSQLVQLSDTYKKTRLQMKESLNSVGNEWKDDNYQSFLRDVDPILNRLNTNIARLDDQIDRLEKWIRKLQGMVY